MTVRTVCSDVNLFFLWEITQLSCFIDHPSLGLEYKCALTLFKVYMKRKFLLSYLKELLKWFCKLLYCFSLTCFVVEIFLFVYDVYRFFVPYLSWWVKVENDNKLSMFNHPSIYVTEKLYTTNTNSNNTTTNQKTKQKYNNKK